MTPPPPETRSQDRLGELEHRLESLNTTMNTRFEQCSQDIADLKLTATRMEEFMQKRLDEFLQRLETRFPPPLPIVGNGKLSLTGTASGTASASGSITHPHVPLATQPRVPNFGTFHELSQPQTTSAYLIPTKQSRVEFSKFDGSDFRGWACRCRQFFDVDSTPLEHRIRLLSIHLEGHTLRWHQTFMRRRPFSEVQWADYWREMEVKFLETREEKPLIALKKLQQADDPVIDYEKKFDELLSEVDIAEDVAVNLFIGGLRADIQQLVLNLAPPSLASAMGSARLQEATVQALHDHLPFRYQKEGSGSTYVGRSLASGSSIVTTMGSFPGPGPTLSSGSPKSPLSFSKPDTPAFPSGSTSILAATPPSASFSKPTRQLTKCEMDDRRRQGLCYWCPTKYSSGHRCQDSQFYLLHVDDDDDYFEDALGATAGGKNPDAPST